MNAATNPFLTVSAKNKNLRDLDAMIAAEMDELDSVTSEGRRLACRNAIADLRARRALMAARPTV